MKFSPMIFRVACAVVAFVVGFAYCLVLAVAPQVQCDGAGSNPFVAATLFAIPLVVLLLLSTRALAYRQAIRWLTVPFVLLVPLAAMGAMPYFDAAGIEHIANCASHSNNPGEARDWHAYWAPGHFAVLALLMVQVLRFWVGRRGTAG